MPVNFIAASCGVSWLEFSQSVSFVPTGTAGEDGFAPDGVPVLLVGALDGFVLDVEAELLELRDELPAAAVDAPSVSGCGVDASLGLGSPAGDCSDPVSAMTVCGLRTASAVAVVASATAVRATAVTTIQRLGLRERVAGGAASTAAACSDAAAAASSTSRASCGPETEPSPGSEPGSRWSMPTETSRAGVGLPPGTLRLDHGPGGSGVRTASARPPGPGTARRVSRRRAPGVCRPFEG